MQLREIKLPGDFDIIQDVITRSFHYPENPEWNVEEDELEGLVDMVGKLKKIWPLMNFLGLFSKSIKHLMMGYIAEVDGVPAGLFMIQRRGSTDKWYVSTVGVLPEFRRKGIARKMVNAGLDLIRELDGEIVLLDVIAGNVPAYSLYVDVGFEHYTGALDFQLKDPDLPELPELPENISLEKLGDFDWKPRCELMDLVTPDEVKKYEPIEEGRFKQPFIMRLALPLIKLAQGSKDHDFLVKVDDKLVGRINYRLRTSSGGRHSLSLFLHKDYAHLSDIIVQYCLAKIGELKDGRSVSAASFQWEPHNSEALKNAGFVGKVEYHRLGMIL